jgi:hypothetical protein
MEIFSQLFTRRREDLTEAQYMEPFWRENGSLRPAVVFEEATAIQGCIQHGHASDEYTLDSGSARLVTAFQAD